MINVTPSLKIYQNVTPRLKERKRKRERERNDGWLVKRLDFGRIFK